MQIEPTQLPQNNLPLSAQRQFESAVAYYADKLVVGVAKHWLALFNMAWGVYVLLPFLAPVLMHVGYATPARVIYGIYSFTCHQLPDHSYFLFGSNHTPLIPDLEAAGMRTGLDLLQRRQFIGNGQIGFKVAICERDVAIYGSVFLGGLLFALLRKRIRAIDIKIYLLFLIPIALDGFTQLFGLRQSNWWLRSITGALFGLASIWLAYPYVDEAMQEVIETEQYHQVNEPSG